MTPALAGYWPFWAGATEMLFCNQEGTEVCPEPAPQLYQ
jgi:hypothetical protein